MAYKKFIFLAILVVLWNASFSQNFKNYTIEDGLPSNNVYRISQDGHGFIWFITDKGVVKFDGKTFKTFTTENGLPLNDIWDVRITPDNKVWYFSKSTSLGYIENDSVYKYPSSVNNEILIPHAIGQNRDSIFFQFNNGSYEVRGNQYLRSEFEKKIGENIKMKIIGDPEVASMTMDTIADSVTFKNKKGSVLWHESYDKENERKRITYGQLNDSLLCFVTFNALVIYNFKSLEKHKVYYKDHLKKEEYMIVRMHEVNDQIQVTGENFVSFLDSDYKFTNIHFLPEELDSHFSFVDRFGNIWAASFSKGVFLLPKKQIITSTYFINDKVQDIEVIDDKIYSSVYTKGLYELNPQNKSYKLIKENPYFNYQVKKIDSAGINIYSTERDVFTFNENTVKKENNLFNFMNKNALGRNFEFHNGFIYGNTHYGINKIDPKSFERVENYPGFGLNDLISYKNRLFFGSFSGLWELKEGLIKKVESNIGFNHPILSFVKIKDSKMLIGTDGFGLYAFDGKEFEFIKGSESFSIEDIFVENKNAFWIATQNGVHKYSIEKDTFRIDRSYFVSDGLLSNKVNAILLKDNILHVGTDIGLSSFSISDTEEREGHLHSIYIKDIKVNGQSIDCDDPTIDFERNSSYQINYGIIDFTDQEQLSRYYRLLPDQNHWIDFSSDQINLSNLPPKNYILEIKAEHPERFQIVKELKISILPRFWQKLWFQILASVLGLILIVYSVYRISRNHQIKQNQRILFENHLSEVQLKALRSQMNPHFVFNSLAGIQYFINKKDFKTSEAYLLKFSKLVRQFFEQAKENEILISDELKLLKRYLEIEKLRFKDKLNYQFNIDDRINVNSVKIPTLLLQPIVENAVNHGIFNKVESGIITVDFHFVDDETFKVEIIDDGVGVKNTRSKTNNQIKSSIVLKERIYFLNQSGKWKIEYTSKETYPDFNEPGNTTTFIIKKIGK